jgi:hypothetical protein
MYDQPNITQMVIAVRGYLEREIAPDNQVNSHQSQQRENAIRVLGMIEREIQMNVDHLKGEWARLNFVQKVTTPMPADPNEAKAALLERNRKLCEEISAGRFDYAPARAALFEHLLITTRTHLEVANPDFLQFLAAEDEKQAG